MSDMTACINDLSYITPNNEQNNPTQGDIGETSNELTQAKRNKFEELYASANVELYLEYLQEVFPIRLGYKVPPSYYEIKKKFKMIRWKDNQTMGKKVPKKVLRYFSIIPRLKCFYKSNHTSKHMTWHAAGKYTENGKMQHPVDGKAWKNSNTRYPNLATGSRNVQLGLAVDGFNLFGNLSQSYIMCPVIVTTYNLPPWLYMEETSFMLTLLIHGPKSPGKDIDVYLRPLIDDLKDLWELAYVETIDAATSKTFNMRAMLLWTINDFLLEVVYLGGVGKVTWHALHVMKILHVNVEISDKDMKQEFPSWFGPQICQCYIDIDPCITDKLFALVCGPSSTPISVNSCIVNDVRFVVHSHDERCTTQNNGVCSPGEKGEEMYHDGQSTNVKPPPDIIDVDDDDDFIDDKDDVPHDLAYSNDEVLANDDDDVAATVMSAAVARGHGGNGGGDDPSSPSTFNWHWL
ncbi:transmembrane protein 45B-like protein [Tanacetum coccineum]